MTRVPDYILDMDLGHEPGGFLPDIRPLWHPESGTEPVLESCPACLRSRRLVSYTLQTCVTRACLECLLSRGLSHAIRMALMRAYQASEDGWLPSDPRATREFLQGDPEASHEALLLALEASHFMTSPEVLALAVSAGMKTRAGAIRRLSLPALWLLDPSLPSEHRPPEWVRVILNSLLEPS